MYSRLPEHFATLGGWIIHGGDVFQDLFRSRRRRSNVIMTCLVWDSAEKLFQRLEQLLFDEIFLEVSGGIQVVHRGQRREQLGHGLSPPLAEVVACDLLALIT